MSQGRRMLARHAVDAVLVVLAVVAAAGTATRDDLPHDGVAAWVLIAAAAGLVLPLVGRRRFPFLAPATLWIGSAALSFVDGRLVTSQTALYVTGIVGAAMLGALPPGRQRHVGLVVVLGSAVVVVRNSPGSDPADLVFTPAIFAMSWLVGYALRERTERTEAAEGRAARAEAEREAAARVAVAEERARIARELHDIVAHAMSVMVLQVGAVRHDLPQSSTHRKALEDVERAGRSALTEMRRLLGALRREDEAAELAPHPGLEELPSLLDRVRAAGLEVSLATHGDPRTLPPALSLSAYRIVQEGLTNTLRHAGASRAEVAVRYGEDAVTVEVRDDGRGGQAGANGTRAASADGTGHGLVGVAERVKIYGGQMSAARDDDGCFVLRARLPVSPGEREASR